MKQFEPHVEEVEETIAGLYSTHCRTFFLLCQPAHGPVFRSVVALWLTSSKAVEAFSAGWSSLLKQCTDTFSQPPGRKLRCAFQQTKLAFSESSPHHTQPHEHQRGRLLGGPASHTAVRHLWSAKSQKPRCCLTTR